MSKQNRFLKFFKDGISRILHRKPIKSNALKESDWVCHDDKIEIKKRELEDIENELVDKSNIIKKLKTENASNLSIIEDYENAFEKISFVDYCSGSKVNIKSSSALLEDELVRLRSSESRLKSHIQALKRELVLIKQECDAKLDVKNKIIDNQKRELEDKDFLVKKQSNTIQELSIANTNLSYQLESRCCDPPELVQVCKELSDDLL